MKTSYTSSITVLNTVGSPRSAERRPARPCRKIRRRYAEFCRRAGIMQDQRLTHRRVQGMQSQTAFAEALDITEHQWPVTSKLRSQKSKKYSFCSVKTVLVCC